jgi:tRNA nucleotidyltransferase (CCA-adding enzyme)
MQLRLDSEEINDLLAYWEREVESLEPLITGADLLAAGWEPGPQLGAVLRRVRAAQLDGVLTSRSSALDKAACWRADREA